MIATFINAFAVVLGSLVGLFLKGKIPEKYEQNLFTALGAFTLVLGISIALKPCNPLYMVFAIVAGGLIGTWLKIEEKVLNLGTCIKSRLPGSLGEGQFAAGFLDASVLFCVGAMTILGSFKAGIEKDYELLLLKSVMDGSISVLFASIMGFGVLFSAVSILLVQGSLTLLSSVLAPHADAVMVDAVSAVGGLLIVMIGINLLGLKKIPVANFTPAILLIIIFQLADPWLPSLAG